MIDSFSLALIHALLGILLWRLVKTPDPDDPPPPPPRRRQPPRRIG